MQYQPQKNVPSSSLITMPPKRKAMDSAAPAVGSTALSDNDGVKFTLQCKEGTSNKFYEVVLSRLRVTSRYGRIGTSGTSSYKDFTNRGEAIFYAEGLRKEKTMKGYAPASSEEEDPRPAKSTKVEPAESMPPPTFTEVDSEESFYYECKEGGSSKFYELRRVGGDVKIRYGRIGTDGVASEKSFGADISAASQFVTRTVAEKEKKGYSRVDRVESIGAVNEMPQQPSSGNLAEDLENGLKVYVKGSSALPYTLRKFNGGYSCTCPGWAIHVRLRGVQATSCKHLKEVRGVETEAERCQAFAGTVVPSSSKNASIPGKISLAQQWTTATDPAGYVMSEKLDGMRAYWCGKKLWTRSGLPIVAPDWFTAALPSTLALDGELFLGRKQFDECMSIARRTDASAEWKALRYVVFDAPTVEGGILTRLEKVTAALAAAGSSGGDLYWSLHPHEVCQGTEQLVQELARVEALGGEGLMLRSATAPHRGGRSSDLLKVKSFHDDEALVLDHEAGKGKYQGQVGSLVCVTRQGARFKVGSGLVDAMRGCKQAPQPGTVITFKYFELTKDGIPRFPTFLRVRPDMHKSEFPTV
jgi:DNA ligase-1